MADQRLKGQEVSVRVIQAGTVIGSIDSVSSMNDTVGLETKEDGFLGETVNRFDEVLNGFGGDFEFQVNRANWEDLVKAILDRATRLTPDVSFNIIRTDFFPNGDTNIYVYTDVHFGAIPTSIPSRGDYVKPRLEFKCSERPVQTNALP